MAAPGRTVIELSSLPLQMFFYLNTWYSVVFCVAELLLFVYKGTILPYPSMAGTLTVEILLVLLLAFIESVRLFFGYKGNLSERSMALIVSMILAIPTLFIELFILLWQTYVLRLEVILVAIQLVLLALEVILSIATMFTFQKYSSMQR
ncbi:transmembrane protein 216-like [Actinia tenebrosa]|uniref:Transmembrane protein 216-like n=1 Tax=Actinia tenebrosa TaxID=6105 RepID=A0A6P8I4H2_ACTTE|nr:transmembrane protein 216-like [Actinia tenebrosa]